MKCGIFDTIFVSPHYYTVDAWKAPATTGSACQS